VVFKHVFLRAEQEERGGGMAMGDAGRRGTWGVRLMVGRARHRHAGAVGSCLMPGLASRGLQGAQSQRCRSGAAAAWGTWW
jgi:hypothetical protein